MPRRYRFSLFIIVPFVVLVSLAGCTTKTGLDPSARGLVPIPHEAVERVMVRSSDLAAVFDNQEWFEWSRRTTNTFVSLAELGFVDTAWLQPQVPSRVVLPETVDVEKSHMVLPLPCCGSTRYHTGVLVWVPGQMCLGRKEININGIISVTPCTPIPLGTLVNVTCVNDCNAAGLFLCTYEVFGQRYSTYDQPTSGVSVCESWYPCNNVNMCCDSDDRGGPSKCEPE